MEEEQKKYEITITSFTHSPQEWNEEIFEYKATMNGGQLKELAKRIIEITNPY